MGKQYYAIQQAQREADIYIFGDIVPFEFFEGDVSAHGITQQIKDLDVDRSTCILTATAERCLRAGRFTTPSRTIRPR